jgi:hypothetical protein
LDLEWARVDLREKITLVNVLTLFEGNADELPVHATVYRDSVECRDGSQTVEVDRKVTSLRRGNDDGHNKIAPARSTRSTAALACRRRRRGVRCFAWSPRASEIPNAADKADNNQRPEPP